MKFRSLFVLLLPLALLAQETMIITGRITNFETGVALADANVMIIGTPYGSAASAVGIYRVTYPISANKRDSIRISVNYIGYKSAVLTIPVIAGRSMMDFYLVKGAIQMKEVLVKDRWVEPTRAEKARAYQVVTIDREAIQNSGARNVVDILRSRVPNLRVLDGTSGNVIGSSKRISVRGNMAWPGDIFTQPLFVVDDIPFRVSNDYGTEITDLINEIEMSDIEKIEVVVGQGMFWKYGTEAKNGCIMIWTKKSTFKHLSTQASTNIAGDMDGAEFFDYSPIRFTLYGGAALRQGDFGPPGNVTIGSTEAGYFAMIEGVKLLSTGLYITSSITLALNGLDQAHTEYQMPGNVLSTGMFITTWVMTGFGFEKAVSPTVKFYGVVQLGALISDLPVLTLNDGDTQTTITTGRSTTSAVGLGGGIIVNRINMGVRYNVGHPVHIGSTNSGGTSQGTLIPWPVQLFQIVVGIEI